MASNFKNLLNLHHGEDNQQKTLDNIKSNISFEGANLWILACAIIIACVGLNVNSTAVIIGAMLISPLMGPIVGAGFALGIYDFSLLKKSVRNLLMATLAALIVSTIYFLLSPFKDVQSEILARTSPNIYDILIAFFGGLVGVIATTRVEKGNPIPGVAIATALMPPLCTAGYGLATGNFNFFFGAFFLYGINCVFICLATYSIVKILQYPEKEELNKKYKKKIKSIITVVVLLMLLPAIYFAYRLFTENQYKNVVNKFVEKTFINNGNTIVYQRTNYFENPKTIELAFLSKRFSKKEIDSLNNLLQKEKIPLTKLIIRQDSIDRTEILRNNILNEIKTSRISEAEKENQIAILESRLAEQKYDGKQILVEVKVFFPTIESLSISNNTFYFDNDSTVQKTLILYHTAVDISTENKIKFVAWLRKRLQVEDIEIIQQ